MTEAKQGLIDVANEGQTDKQIFKGEAFTRSFAGRVKTIAELANPLSLSLLVSEIDKTLEIVDPSLKPEIEWLKKVQSAIKLFHNEIVITNRVLGIKDDNSYDARLFEKVVRERFAVQLQGKPVKLNTPIKTDFQTMVNMVEMGVRRFTCS